MLAGATAQVEVFTLMSVSGWTARRSPAWHRFQIPQRGPHQRLRSAAAHPRELIALPKGQAFALLEGSQLWKLRIPLPVDDSDMPESLAEIANEMERAYITNDSNGTGSRTLVGSCRDIPIGPGRNRWLGEGVNDPMAAGSFREGVIAPPDGWRR